MPLGTNAPAAEARLAEARRGPFASPVWEGRALPSIASSALRAIGRERSDEPPGAAPPLAADLDPLAGSRTEGPVVILLVDSLGWIDFRTASEPPTGGPGTWANRWRSHAAPLTSVFPSTTTAALTSLSTGVPPAVHGVVGHRQFLPRWGVVADLLRMAPMTAPGQDTLLGPKWDRREIAGAPTLFERGARGGVLTRERFSGTGFSRLLYEGAEFRSYLAASEIALELAELLSRPVPPELLFVYWDELDTALHLRGPDPFLVALELERLGGLLAAAAARMDPARRRATQLWITGDHGQVPAPEEANVPIDRHPEIVQELRHPPGGDRRAGYFAARAGRLGALTEAVRAVLPERRWLSEVPAAIDSGLFGRGPRHPELELRIGDLIAVPGRPVGLTYAAPGDPVPRRPFRGAHSGLEPEELWVPLIAGSLEELVGGSPTNGARPPAPQI